VEAWTILNNILLVFVESLRKDTGTYTAEVTNNSTIAKLEIILIVKSKYAFNIFVWIPTKKQNVPFAI